MNILDLVVVAQAISTEVGEGDVNGDGVVNVFDLVFVAGAIGGGGAAPSAHSLDLSIISAGGCREMACTRTGFRRRRCGFSTGNPFP